MNKEELRILKNRILSMAAAFTMAATPVVANADGTMGNDNNNDIRIELENQQEADAPLTCEEFENKVNECYDYLTKFINYDALKPNLQCLYYLVNHEFIPLEEAKKLEGSVVHGTDVANGEFQNFADAYSLINDILDYNQDVIHKLNGRVDVSKIHYEKYDQELFNKYLTKVVNSNGDDGYNLLDAIRDYNANTTPELSFEVGELCVKSNEIMSYYLAKVISGEYELSAAIQLANEAIELYVSSYLIDVSELCYNLPDKKLVHEMHMNWIQAYIDGKYDNESYVIVFKQLTTLNAAEKAGNAHQLSIGGRWVAENIVGGCVMQMLRDHMGETYPRVELDKYFVPSELNKGQWILRDDVSLELNCLKSELEVEVFQFGELWVVVYDNVNNDILTSFANRCTQMGNSK